MAVISTQVGGAGCGGCGAVRCGAVRCGGGSGRPLRNDPNCGVARERLRRCLSVPVGLRAGAPRACALRYIGGGGGGGGGGGSQGARGAVGGGAAGARPAGGGAAADVRLQLSRRAAGPGGTRPGPEAWPGPGPGRCSAAGGPSPSRREGACARASGHVGLGVPTPPGTPAAAAAAASLLCNSRAFPRLQRRSSGPGGRGRWTHLNLNFMLSGRPGQSRSLW